MITVIVIMTFGLVMFFPFFNCLLFGLVCNNKTVIIYYRLTTCILYGTILMWNSLDNICSLEICIPPYLLIIPVFIIFFIYNNCLAKLGTEVADYFKAKVLVKILSPKTAIHEDDNFEEGS